ncbi:hypothetical protein GCM10027605_17680 [Micromonospora zhanjiangensis]
MTAAITSPINRPVPATRAAGPNAAKTPAPIIEPSPMTTASPVPSRRANRSLAPGRDCDSAIPLPSPLPVPLFHQNDLM